MLTYYIFDMETNKVIAIEKVKEFEEIEFKYDWETYGACLEKGEFLEPAFLNANGLEE